MNSSLLEKVLIIDGNSLLYRAFYALPLLKNRRGEFTNAVYGFANMLIKLLEVEQPDYVAVAFDPPRPSFRSRIDSAYKAQREKTPPELGEQVERARGLLAAMQIAIFEEDDFEADDVIGTLADLFTEQGKAVTVVSGDADLLQLVGDRTTVMLTKKGISQMERYDLSLLQEHYGLSPEQFIEYKALKGDPSDNIAGVPGIGDKTAKYLLEKYGSIESIYADIGSLQGKIAANLQQFREQLHRGKELVALRRDIPIELKGDDCRYSGPDLDKLIPLLNELEFRSLINKFDRAAPSRAVKESSMAAEKAVTGTAELLTLIENLGSGAEIAALVDTEDGWPYWQQEILAIAFAFDAKRSYICDCSDRETDTGLILKGLAAAVEKGSSLLVHDLKHWSHLFANHDQQAPVFSFDTRLAAYVADPSGSGYDLQRLLLFHLGVEVAGGKGSAGKDATGSAKQLNLTLGYANHLFELRDLLWERLREQDSEKLLLELEMPLAAVLAAMERKGISVDLAYLRNISTEICSRIATLEKEIYARAGEEFNLNSPQQLSAILFDKLKLPAIRKTKTGRSTDARVLEELSIEHDIAAILLQYRQLAKLESTYLSGLIELVSGSGKNVYTSLNQTATATGRLSSSDPNLQNIPIRLEEGRRIRRAFIPSGENKMFLAADYSQVELRILAHLSEDKILVEAFKTGQDIHRRTAAEVNGIGLDEVTPLMREKAKAVNFGIIYGSSDYGLAQGLRIPRAEAKAYMENYFKRYSGVKTYMEQVIEEARDKGYVTTVLNRRRYLPEIRSSNKTVRSFAERIALNTPIQGSAADIIKLAMLKIDGVIAAGGFKAEMLLQIHDELLFEINIDELDFFAPMIRREMEQAYSLIVPLQVDLKWGANWEELNKL